MTPTLSHGVLSLKGDTGNDTVKVAYGNTSQTYIIVQADFKDGTSHKGWNVSGVQEIYFNAGHGGNDSFENDTSIPTQADGRYSNATLVGGTGGNTFWVGSTDVVVPRGSNNVTYGLMGGHLKAAQLDAQGQLAVSLIPGLGGKNGTLTLSGPGGAGFQIVGNWVRGGSGASSTYTASGSLTLKTALGSISLAVPPALPLTVSYSADSTGTEGTVTGITLSGIPDLSVNNTGPLKTLSNELGLTVSLPSVSWGISLGSSLSDVNLPLDAGVPYIYASVSTGFSVAFGGASVNSSGGTDLAIAFDPGDPSVAVRYGDFAVGGSLKGYIPFTPWTQPTAAASTPIFGNLYGEADNIQPDPEIPVSLSGSVVINLDAQNTGHPLGISGNTFSKLLSGKESVASLATNAVNDVAIGLNGQVSVGYDVAGFNFSVPVGDATAMYSPGLFAVRGQNPDIFAGTPVNKIVPAALQNAIKPPTYSLDGSISWSTTSSAKPKWHLTAEAKNVKLVTGLASADATLTLSNSGIGIDAKVTTLLDVGSFDLVGFLASDGHYNLMANANASLDLGPFTISGSYTFTLSNQMAYTLSATVSASAGFDIDAKDVEIASGSVTLDGNLFFSIDSSGAVHVSGGGTLTGSASAGPIHKSINVTVNFNDDGFSADLPLIGNVSASW